MTEKELEKKFKEAVRKAGGRAIKFVSPGNSGVPDRLVLFPGGIAGFVELKRPGKKPRAEQRHQIELLRSMGFGAFTLDRPELIPAIVWQIKCNSRADPELVLEILDAGGLL